MATRIYVGNLPYSADNQQLTELFSVFGEVAEATVVIDRDTGQSKGFGFVQMDDEAARNAIAGLNGTMFGNRTIRVNEAQARPDRSGPRHSGGYGDRSRGGYGNRGGGYGSDRGDRGGYGGGYSGSDRGGYSGSDRGDRGGYGSRGNDYSGRGNDYGRGGMNFRSTYDSAPTEPDENSSSYYRHERGRDRDRARRERDF